MDLFMYVKISTSSIKYVILLRFFYRAGEETKISSEGGEEKIIL